MEQINGRFWFRIPVSLFICCTLSFTSSAFGFCRENVQPIKEGQVANCEGFLFSPQAESDAFKAKETSDLQKSENEILEQRLKLYMDENNTLAQNQAKHDSNESYIRLGYFVLGILVTGLTVRNLRP